MLHECYEKNFFDNIIEIHINKINQIIKKLLFLKAMFYILHDLDIKNIISVNQNQYIIFSISFYKILFVI